MAYQQIQLSEDTLRPWAIVRLLRTLSAIQWHVSTIGKMHRIIGGCCIDGCLRQSLRLSSMRQ
jgi:hypothetical protein